ncbi:DcaP family trimeric outer membrane transporter [Sphingomonas sp. 37zxx]|uniref:DcaP family trimeric outer membrane transporter n=1 Tax=Sphingomonas sp. 37zxx TaxID=1550073 RepID=UPI00053BF8A7|nr:DcaP family trimeric outer membrane transporter [Sphingomonas sp. 37zxx]
MRHHQGLLLASVAIASIVAGRAEAQTGREVQLEARLNQLEEAVATLRGELRAARAAPPASVSPVAVAGRPLAPTAYPAVSSQGQSHAAAASPPDGFRVGNTTVKLNGFVRLNTIASRYSAGEVAVGGLGKEFYLPQQIPVGGNFSSEDLLLSARQSRIALSSSTPAGGGEIKTLIEFDFALATAPVGAQRATNPYVPTFRRGFIEYGNLLVGQEWSTFQNVGVLPESTDFVGPLEGTVFNRQALIRYTVPLSKTANLQLAIENPQSETALPGNAALVDTDDDRAPDLVARLNLKPRFGDFAIAAIARELRVDALGVGDSAFGWGVSGSGKVPIGANGSDLRFMATYGQGIGRYLGLGYVPDALYAGPGGQLLVIDNFAGFAAVKLGWTPTLRSTFTGSYQSAQYPEGLIVTGLANAKAYGGAANLFWTPTKGFDVGIEYRHGVRELLNGDTGALDRIEFAIKYGF